MIVMTLAHYLAFLSLLLTLPLAPLVENPPLLALKPYISSCKDWCWLPCVPTSSPWYQPGIATTKRRYCSLVSAQCGCVLRALVCAACHGCFCILLPTAWLHSAAWCSRQHTAENSAGTYLSCQCLPMHFWMVLAGSVCYLFVQWPTEEQWCCCLHGWSRGPAC